MNIKRKPTEENTPKLLKKFSSIYFEVPIVPDEKTYTKQEQILHENISSPRLVEPHNAQNSAPLEIVKDEFAISDDPVLRVTCPRVTQEDIKITVPPSNIKTNIKKSVFAESPKSVYKCERCSYESTLPRSPELVQSQCNRKYEKIQQNVESPSSAPSPLRLIGRHFVECIPPTANKDRPTRQCKVCCSLKNGNGKRIRRETRYYCPDCDVGLCIECFKIYHTKEVY